MTSYTHEKAKTDVLLALRGALGKEYVPMLSDLELPKDPSLGDLAFPCFRLAKGLSRNPVEIAREVVTKIAPKGFIREARANGPYINFFFDENKVFTDFRKQVSVLSEKFGVVAKKKRRVMVEYSGLNTHKPVHIGHVRNNALGAALVRLMRAQGIQVIAADFVNDLGLHVAQWLWWFGANYHNERPKDIPIGKFLIQVYVEAVAQYDASEEAKAGVAETLKKLEAKDRALMRIWKTTRGWCMKEFDRFHEEVGAKFDTAYAESQVADDRKAIVEALLHRGIAEYSQGAVIVNMEDVGLGVFVILRSDGTALYATTDLALAIQKFKDEPELDASYCITDTRQKQHFAQLYETLRRFGRKEDFRHIGYEFVTLPEGAMSSRKGTVILYDDLRDELIARASEETRKRHPDWKPKKVASVARELALGAMKFDMLKQDPEKAIVFDMKEALSFDGFSAPYLQYMSARIAGILRKAKAPKRGVKPAAIPSGPERKLILHMLRYPDVVQEAALTFRPSSIAQYLFTLAQLFAAFYEAVPVATAADAERALHLEVLRSAKQILLNGLALLGISTVDEM